MRELLLLFLIRNLLRALRPLARDASERPGTSGRGMAAGELPPLKRHDIAKGWEGCKGERRAPQKNPPHERKNTLFPVGRIQLLAEAKVS